MAASAGRHRVALVNLKVGQGTTNDYHFRWMTGPVDARVPVNLTGYTARAQIRDRVGGTVYASVTTGSGITLGGATGTIDIAIVPTVTEATPWNTLKRGRWDLEMISPAGKVTRLLEGDVEVSWDVTRV